mgnify:CR=1 FL=1
MCNLLPSIGSCRLLAVAIFVGIVGCGEKSPQEPAPDPTTDMGGDQTKAAPAPVTLPKTDPSEPPEKLGAEIGEHFLRMISELNGLLESKPAVAEIQPKIEALRLRYIDVFVAYAKRLDGMSTAYERKLRVAQAKAGTDMEPLMKFAKLKKHYEGIDPKFFSLLEVFETLTGFTNLSVIRTEHPADAKRLGLK